MFAIVCGLPLVLPTQVSAKTITEIMHVGLIQPQSIALDAIGNVYVAGFDSDNVFKITPSGNISGIINFSGDGSGNIFRDPVGIVAGNVYGPVE